MSHQHGGDGQPHASPVTVPASQAFTAHAHEYTQMRRRLVPGFDAFYASAVDALGLFGAGSPTRVLDIGAGTGLLAAAVAERYPHARFELLDGSEAMLAQVPPALSAKVDRTYVADMAAGLPAGPYDCVVSALAIHHLQDADKQRLFAHAHAALAPGGVFVNAEQVSGPTPALTDVYERKWADDCRALAADEEMIEAARVRKLHDRCADVESQLRWLREAGFAAADCVWKSWCFATIVAIKS